MAQRMDLRLAAAKGWHMAVSRVVEKGLMMVGKMASLMVVSRAV